MEPDGRTKHVMRVTGWLRGLVTVLASVALACGMVLLAGGSAQAAQAESNRMATWNMLYGPEKWHRAFQLAQFSNVVALQEVPDSLPRELRNARHENVRGSIVPGSDGVRHWRWERDGVVRHLYIIRTPSRHMGMITQTPPDRVFRVNGPYRPGLAVVNRNDNVLFASVHASASNGGDSGALLREIADAARPLVSNWVALGDFNRQPDALEDLDLPEPHFTYRPNQATTGHNEFDYGVGNVETDRWTAEVHHNTNSNHWPVVFGGLRGAAEQPQASAPHNGGFRGATERPQASAPVNDSAHTSGMRVQWGPGPFPPAPSLGHSELRKRDNPGAAAGHSDKPDLGAGQTAAD